MSTTVGELFTLEDVDVEEGCPGTEYCGRKLEKLAAAAAAGAKPASAPPALNPPGNCAICAAVTRTIYSF